MFPTLQSTASTSRNVNNLHPKMVKTARVFVKQGKTAQFTQGYWNIGSALKSLYNYDTSSPHNDLDVFKSSRCRSHRKLKTMKDIEKSNIKETSRIKEMKQKIDKRMNKCILSSKFK